MPLYEYRCVEGHLTECYVPLAAHAGTRTACRQCAGMAERQFPLPNVPQYFSESNGRIITNLAPGVPIHSHAQHQRLMKDKGLEPATEWHTRQYKQTDGLPTRAPKPHPATKILD